MSKHQLNTLIFGLFSLLVFYCYSLGLWFLGFLIWLILLVVGTFKIQWNYHLKSTNSLGTKEQIVALTFDDGPTPFTTVVLDLLKKHNAKATFFCIGRQIEQYPEIFLRIIQEGHTVGNHTFTHAKSMGFKGVRALEEEIIRTNSLIKDISGQSTHFFRPPFGVTNPNMKMAIKKCKMQSIGWSIRSLDTVIQNERDILKRIENKLQPGSIILLHDTTQKSVDTLALLLKTLDQKSLKCVTINHD